MSQTQMYRKFIADLVDMTDYAYSPHRKNIVDGLINAIENDCLDKEVFVEFLTATRTHDKPVNFSRLASLTSLASSC